MFGNYDLNFLIFGIMPYAVLAVALVGTIARYERDPFTWKTSSSQLLRRKQLMWGSVLFHVGIIVLFFGHLIGLFTPVWILDALGIPYGVKQWVAVILGGIAGLSAFIGATMLLHRRLFDARIRVNSSFADIAILAILWLQIVIGMGTIIVTLDHMDGAGMVLFMTWSQSVMTLQLNAWTEVINVHWLYKAHIVLGMVIVALFPFTRLVHMLSVPIRYVTLRPGYQIVRSRRGRPLEERRQAYDARQGKSGPSATTPAE
ncbi:MAG: respiratory nitrate reductase subunit gamma [Pseudotabrizicola sp.]|uniref:respiratory nitrate reductase subunit gamma n=1 Tax=Pseudotabrizicola sp. TaxID=2939647 RepID=UPI0027232EE3|nr:respiratory nitrate reductase subunit gamma [Pseudotabrizicola sp.]MDO8884293.1 respiratory nitrate reductase subunit gamma [Pseudotabrizicola sp.]MDP2080257.1 respiratory nitrate reductase subunit gamma [Pseudotabrizicola sp.]MDZ7575342.1 respiratory nitrate reductase subunit gamma [Pseudotabrizicola sp.]